MKCWFLLILLILLSACSSNVADPLAPPTDPNQPNGELVFKEDEDLQEKIAALGEEAKGKLGVFALLMEVQWQRSFRDAERRQTSSFDAREAAGRRKEVNARTEDQVHD